MTNIGSDLWMAPEIQGTNPRFGHPADVFGFGCLRLVSVSRSIPGRGEADWIEIFAVPGPICLPAPPDFTIVG